MATDKVVYWPVDPSTITEEAGTRGGDHDGIDFGLPIGTPLVAAFDGVVVANYNDGASGKMWAGNGWVYANGPALITEIQRNDGFLARYAHLNRYALPTGSAVIGGETIVGFSGNSGFSTGPHLHWSLRWDRRLSGGNWVNPRALNLQVPGNPTEHVDIENEEEEMSVIYTRPTGNSSPTKANDATSSRIWAGDNREYKGTKYSGTWAIDVVSGEARRLTMAEWSIVQAAYQNSERKLPIAAPTGNELEIVIYGPKGQK